MSDMITHHYAVIHGDIPVEIAHLSNGNVDVIYGHGPNEEITAGSALTLSFTDPARSLPDLMDALRNAYAEVRRTTNRRLQEPPGDGPGGSRHHDHGA